MRKIYRLHSYDGMRTWTIIICSSKKIAEEWKRYYDKHNPEIEHTVLEDVLINFAPIDD